MTLSHNSVSFAANLQENTRLRNALEFYANRRNWVNERELKAFPTWHGSAVARVALDGESVGLPLGEGVALFPLPTTEGLEQ